MFYRLNWISTMANKHNRQQKRIQNQSIQAPRSIIEMELDRLEEEKPIRESKEFTWVGLPERKP